MLFGNLFSISILTQISVHIIGKVCERNNKTKKYAVYNYSYQLIFVPFWKKFYNTVNLFFDNVIQYY